jgi:hypothetical protein
MAKTKIYPTKEYLLECFDYNRETGELFWKKRPAEHFDSAKAWRIFNSTYVGKLAGNRARGGAWAVKFYFGNQYQRSTLVHILETGTPNARKITHINGDNSDDRFDNLSLIKNNTNGYSKTKVGLWQSRINYRGKFYCLGTFKTEKEATDVFFKAVDDISKNRFIHKPKMNVTGRKGVTKHGNDFVAKVKFNGITQHIGTFETIEEAALAYQKAKREIEEGVFIPPIRKLHPNKTGYVGVQHSGSKFKATHKGKHLGTFNTPEEAHEAYLNAKNPPLTFDTALAVLANLGTKITNFGN